jgi:putative transcriptional regulator
MATYFRLRALLAAREMTQTELQNRTGVAYSTISAIYHNRAKGIDLAILDKFCSALACQVEDIIEFVPGKKRSRS